MSKHTIEPASIPPITRLMHPGHHGLLVRRNKLLKRLNDERGYPFILIDAAPGTGKTTLLAQWRKDLMAAGMKVAWYSLEESDADLSLFVLNLIESLNKAGIHVSSNLNQLYQRTQRAREQPFIDALVNELDSLRHGVYLFLDDFQCVDQSGLSDLVLRLVELAPDNFHLVIASCNAPPLPIASWKAHNRMVELTTLDLLFDRKETEVFLNNRLTQTIGSVGVSEIHEATEGWATALQLATIPIRQNSNPLALFSTFPHAGRDIGAFVTTEIIGRLPPDLSKFLFTTSILDKFCPELCDHLTGNNDATDKIREIGRRNLFIIPLEGQGNWYRYHAIFAEVLQTNLKIFSAVELERLHLAASDWLYKAGYSLDAVHHAFEAGAHDRALRLVENCALSLIEQGRWPTLVSWFELLKGADPVQHPQLYIAAGLAQTLSMQLREADRTLEYLAPFAKELKPPSTYGLAFMQGLRAMYNDDCETAQSLLYDLPQKIPSESTVIGVGCCNILAWSYICLGEFDQSRVAFERSMRFRRAGFVNAEIVYAECLHGLSYAKQGKLDASESIFRRTLKLVEEEYGRRSLIAGIPAGLLADVVYEKGDAAEAWDIIEDRLEMIRKTFLPDLIMRACIVAARACTANGDPAEGLTHLYALQTDGETAGLNRLIVTSHAERVRFYLAAQDFATASAIQSNLMKLVDPYDPYMHNTSGETALIAALSGVRIDLCEGRISKAIDTLNPLYEHFTATLYKPYETQILVLFTIAEQLNGKTNRATEYMRAVLANAVSYGFRRSIVDEFMPFEELLEKCIGPLCNESKFAQVINELLNNNNSPKVLNGAEIIPNSEIVRLEVTSRESEVLELLGRGLPNKRIAAVLGVSCETVKFHLKNLYRKLSVSGRSHALEKARRLGML